MGRSRLEVYDNYPTLPFSLSLALQKIAKEEAWSPSEGHARKRGEG